MIAYSFYNNSDINNFVNRTPLEMITPSGDAIIKEVTAVLREWLELWKKLFLVKNTWIDINRTLQRTTKTTQRCEFKFRIFRSFLLCQVNGSEI